MIDSFVKDIEPSLMKWRRDFHRKPELGFTEYLTTYLIGKELLNLGFTIYIGQDALVSNERMGVPDQEILLQQQERAKAEGVEESWLEKMQGGHTGLAARFDTGKPGPHMAFRFDIDALPIKETSQGTHLPNQKGFRSHYEHVMHACGHDGHTAIGLGVAAFLSACQENLCGTFTLLFQPGEEGGRGAMAMVDKGWLDDVDYFASGHIGIRHSNVGVVSATTNSFLASTKLNVTYRGKAAHAGLEPEKGKNALLAAAAATLHLYSIPRHSGGKTRINVGKLHGGSGRNIVADEAKLEIETRGETTAINHYMVEEAMRILHASGELYGVETEIETVGNTVEADCDQEWIQWLSEVAGQSSYITEVNEAMPLNASEDVTFMINRVREHGGKATYMVFGTPIIEGHHHAAFDYDEDVMSVGVAAFAQIICKFTQQKEVTG